MVPFHPTRCSTKEIIASIPGDLTKDKNTVDPRPNPKPPARMHTTAASKLPGGIEGQARKEKAATFPYPRPPKRVSYSACIPRSLGSGGKRERAAQDAAAAAAAESPPPRAFGGGR